MSSTGSSQETEITLYNPSSEEAEEFDPASRDRNVIDIEIDRSLAGRLLEVSKHLGLNPTIVASRAIDLVCEEIGTLDEDWRDDEDEFGTVTLIQRYQARVDLLQALKEESDEISSSSSSSSSEQQASTGKTDQSSDEEEELWDAVDEIKDVLDEVDEAVESAEEDVGARDEGIIIKEDESPPTEEFTVDKSTLEKKGPQESDGDADTDSSRWKTVNRIMNVFSSSDKKTDDRDEKGVADASDDSVPTEEIEVDQTTSPEDDDSPPTAEFPVDEEALEEDAPEEEEEDVSRSKDWDAVESIIEEGEQARR